MVAPPPTIAFSFTMQTMKYMASIELPPSFPITANICENINVFAATLFIRRLHCPMNRLNHRSKIQSETQLPYKDFNFESSVKQPFITKIKGTNPWDLALPLSHHVHIYWVGKAEERRHRFRISELKISACLRTPCKFCLLNFKLYVLNVQIKI